MSSTSTAVFPLPLSYTSFTLGIVSFVITVLNLLALYANAVATIRAAPQEIRDALGNLRQQLCEEREALRQQRREVREKTRHHHRRHSQPRRSHGSGSEAVPALVLSYSEQTLALHYVTLRDLWQRFKTLERPFLVSSGTRAEAIRRGDTWREEDLGNEKVRADVERHGESGSFADWTALYRCDFVHRFIWWQSKGDVRQLADQVQRVMLRRLAREATHTRDMVRQLLEGGDRGGVLQLYQGGGGGGGGGGGPPIGGPPTPPVVRRSMSRGPRVSGQSVQVRERRVSMGADTASNFSDSDDRPHHHRVERRARRQREGSIVSEHRTSQPRTEVFVADGSRNPPRR